MWREDGRRCGGAFATKKKKTEKKTSALREKLVTETIVESSDVCVVLCWGPRARSVRQKRDPWKSVWHTYDVIFLPTPDLRNFWTCGLSGAAWITNVSGVRVETKKAVLQTSRCNYDLSVRRWKRRGTVFSAYREEETTEYRRSHVSPPPKQTHLFPDERLAVAQTDLQINLELLLNVLHRGFLQIRVLQDLMQALDNRAVHFLSRFQLLELGGHVWEGNGGFENGRCRRALGQVSRRAQHTVSCRNADSPDSVWRQSNPGRTP